MDTFLQGVMCTLVLLCSTDRETHDYSLDPVSGLRDRVEIYNIPSASSRVLNGYPKYLSYFLEFNGDFTHKHPQTVQDHLAEIQEFSRVNTPFISAIPGNYMCL